MSELLLVLKREFVERVRARSFVLGTIAFPVFLVAVTVLPYLFNRGGEERTVVVVDETPEKIGDRVAALLGAEPETEKENRYRVEHIAGPMDERLRAELDGRLLAEEIDGYLLLPSSLLSEGSATYRSRSVAGPLVIRDLRQAATRAVQAERLRQAGLEVASVAALLGGVSVENVRVTAAGTEGADAMSSFAAAYVMAMALYFIIAFYGMSVLRSVLEEKTSRIAEVLISSLRASHLLAGKILGAGSVALLQVALWIGALVLIIGQIDTVIPDFELPPGVLDAVAVGPVVGITLVAFFVLGFFLYAALFAALGAAVTSEQEAQSFQMVLMVPLFVPMLFLLPLTTEPLGTAATVLGLIPFTSPIAMPMRMAASPLPPLQIAASLGLLALSVPLVAAVAGKIFRIGILATGRRPTIRELVMWLRMV